jgi:hypothetical protein
MISLMGQKLLGAGERPCGCCFQCARDLGQGPVPIVTSASPDPERVSSLVAAPFRGRAGLADDRIRSQPLKSGAPQRQRQYMQRLLDGRKIATASDDAIEQRHGAFGVIEIVAWLQWLHGSPPIITVAISDHSSVIIHSPSISCCRCHIEPSELSATNL